MKILFAMAALALLTLVAPMARAEGSDDQYIQIFNAIQQGDSLNERGEFANATAKYTEAQTALQQFQTEYPTWNPKIVKYRIEYVGAKIAELSAKKSPAPVATLTNEPAAPSVPTSALAVSLTSPPRTPTNVPAETAKPPVPAVVPPPAPAVSTELENEVKTLQVQVRQIQADNVVLEAKLKEALSAQPAAVDPRELARAQGQIKGLQKENDLLKVSLDESKARNNAVPGAAELEQAKKALAEANGRLVQLAAVNATLTKEKETLQANVKAPAAPDPAMIALRDENLLLKNQVAEFKSKAGTSTDGDDVNRKLLEAQAQLAVLQSDKEMLRLEKIALENRVKQMSMSSVPPPVAIATPTPAVDDAVAAKKIKQLETQRDELQKSLTAAREEIAARKKGGETNKHLDDMTRELSSLHARIEVLEAPRLPYTDEELALMSKPAPEMLVAAVRSPGTKPKKDLSDEAAGLLAEARRHVLAHEMDKAEQTYMQILKLDEKNVSTLADLASIQIELNHMTEAEKNVKAALALDPDNEYSVFVLGRLRFDQDKFDDALEAFSRAAELDPRDAENQNYLGITLSEKGLRGPAETALRKAIQINPRNADAHANLAVIYITQQPPLVELAKWHYEKALAAGHSHVPNLEKLLSPTNNPATGP
jgi:tetratricopeptide (TPR) repeat protein